MYQRPDLGGVIPHQFANSLAKRQLVGVSRMRERFSRSEDINRRKNERIIEENMLLSFSNETSSNGNDGEFSHNSLELALLEEGKEELAKSDQYNEMEHIFPMVSLSADSNNKWMMVKVQVHASAEQVLAHLWNFGGREMRTVTDVRRELVAVRKDKKGEKRKKMKNDVNANHESRRSQQVHLISLTSHTRPNIEFSNIMVWKRKKRIVARSSSALIGNNNNISDERNSSNRNDTGNSSSYLLVSSPTEQESGNLNSS